MCGESYVQLAFDYSVMSLLLHFVSYDFIHSNSAWQGPLITFPSPVPNLRQFVISSFKETITNICAVQNLCMMLSMNDCLFWANKWNCMQQIFRQKTSLPVTVSTFLFFWNIKHVKVLTLPGYLWSSVKSKYCASTLDICVLQIVLELGGWILIFPYHPYFIPRCSGFD